MTTAYRTPGLPLVTPRPAPTFRPQLRAIALAGFVALWGFGVRALEHAAQSPETRLAPELVAFADALPIALAATWIWAGWLVLRHGIWTVRHRTLLVRATYVCGSLLVHGAVVALSTCALVVASPDWLFGAHAVASAASPDGRSVAYLYGPGLLSGCSVYVRPSDELYAHRVTDSLACTGDTAKPSRVVWPDGSASPVAVDARGEPLPRTPPFVLFGFGGC